MYKCVIAISFIILIFSSLFSQGTQEQIDQYVNLDYSRFQYDESSSYLEFYYSILPTRDLIENVNYEKLEFTFNIYKLPDLALQATTPVNISLQNYRDNTVQKNQASIGLIKTVLPVGEYKIELIPQDLNLSSIYKRKEMSFKLDIFKNDRITLSDIELASNITRSQDKSSSFYKNTLEVIPNPAAYYSPVSKQLGYYIELYNVSQLGTGGEINISASVSDLQGNVSASKEYKRNKKNDSYVEVGFLDISMLKTGYYTFIFSVTDLKEDYSIYRKKLIYINHPRMEQGALASNLDQLYENSEYKYILKQEIDNKVDQALYLCDNNQKQLARRLTTVEAKRKWLFHFWYDKEQQMPGFTDEYRKRLEIVNEKYTRRGKEGWRSDRGRVYLVYGKPGFVERYPSNMNTNAYEEWEYPEILGGVVFYFIDEMGSGEYRLVHSTHKDEIYDPNWKTYLY